MTDTMSKLDYVALPKTEEKLFRILLLFYPLEFRKRFGEEIELVFQEKYGDQMVENGSVGLGFWTFQFADIIKSIVQEHIQTAQKQGMKKYFQKTLHISRYNVIGGVLLLPFITMFCIDFIGRIVQGDLMHYNRPLYHFFAQTPLETPSVLFLNFIVFPFLAVILNLVPLFQFLHKKHRSIVTFNAIQQNSISLIVLAAAFAILAFLPLHDFIPCVMKGIYIKGTGNILYILSVCRNA